MRAEIFKPNNTATISATGLFVNIQTQYESTVDWLVLALDATTFRIKYASKNP